MFITLSKTAGHLCLSRYSTCQSTPLCSLTLRLTLILLKWRIWWAPHIASRWQMVFTFAFKGLNLMLSSFQRPGLPRNFFPLGFPTKTVSIFLLPMPSTCLAHFISLDMFTPVTPIMFGEQYKLWSFYLSSLPLSSPQPRTVGSAHFPNLPTFCSARKVTPQAAHKLTFQP